MQNRPLPPSPGIHWCYRLQNVHFLLVISEAAGQGNKPTPAQMELRLVQCKGFIENPKIEIHAQNISPAKSWGWLPFSMMIYLQQELYCAFCVGVVYSFLSLAFVFGQLAEEVTALNRSVLWSLMSAASAPTIGFITSANTQQLGANLFCLLCTGNM